MIKKTMLVGGTLVVLVLVLAGVTGWAIYTNASDDPISRADAIVVLSGEHDGREEYGLQLLRDGLAPTLVISNPYPSTDPVIQRVCSTRVPDGEVLCRRPGVLTTTGEALLTRDLAKERGWRKVIIVSLRYQLPRARVIFQKCFSDAPGALSMRSVPTDHHYSFAWWEFTYLYQHAGMVKTLLHRNCE